MWKVAIFKIACCGTPLLVLLVASGALAVVDVAVGAVAVGLAIGGWLLWQHRRACACEIPEAPAQREDTSAAARSTPVNGRRAAASAERSGRDRLRDHA
jgi:hypothetical protein